MKTYINLLPRPFRRRLVLRSCLLQWSVVWVVTGAAVAGICYEKHSRLETVRRELAALNAQCKPLRLTDQENQTLQTRIALMRGRQSLLTHLDAGLHPLQVIGLVSRSAEFVGGRLRVEKMSFQVVEVLQSVGNNDEETKSPAPIKTFRLTLNGIASNNLAVSKFIVALRDSGFFESVELRSSERTEMAGGRARKFLVDCAM